MDYKNRAIESKLQSLSKGYPVIVISGPRQSGKSTLAKNYYIDHEYVTLEDLDIQAFAKDDPRGFLDQYKNKKVIIDEVQNVPGLFSYIQGIVDINKSPAEFVLTGSAQLDLIEKVSQSLAGRASILELLPFSKGELDQSGKQYDLEDILFSGSYPRVHFESFNAIDWYYDYIRNYLERDLRKVINVKDLGTFQLFLKMCAARCGQLINYSNLANDCGISPNTAKEWINVLKATYIVFTLNPHFKNYSKRLIKSQKLYFYDTGVVCALLGITSPDQLVSHAMRGGIFESWVIADIHKQYFNQHRPAPTFFWRNNKGIEIDLILETSEKVLAIEIKSGKTVHTGFFKNLEYYKKLAGENLQESVLIYGGHQSQNRSNVKILSWKDINALSDTTGN